MKVSKTAVILLFAIFCLLASGCENIVTGTGPLGTQMPTESGKQDTTVTPGAIVEGTVSPETIEQWAKSVVKLEVYNSKDEKINTGSGFAAFDTPVLITARHVVVNMKYMIATRDDGTTFKIERLIAEDETSDLAICYLPEDAGIPALLPSESLPRRGEWVAAIGTQFGVRNLVTLGNVCGIWDPGDVERILFTAPVSGGNSGGPLFNANGQFVGIVTGTYDKGQNMNVAATFESAVKLYKTLKLN